MGSIVGRLLAQRDQPPSFTHTTVLLADTILHAIHGRVLEHVKAEAEKSVPNR